MGRQLVLGKERHPAAFTSHGSVTTNAKPGGHDASEPRAPNYTKKNERMKNSDS